MIEIKEKDLLRLSMILEPQGATTRDRYVCKFVEYVLFDSKTAKQTAFEIYSNIKERFLLEFDISEIENAIDKKGKGRIVKNEHYYSLTPLVVNQLAAKTSFSEELKNYIKQFSVDRKGIDETILFNLILKYLYFCFNSNVINLRSVINEPISKESDVNYNDDFKPSKEETNVINAFLRWDNADKNKLLYSIVSSCYEYCLITSNKNPTISKSVFRGKKFFLDTNLIFRIAGFNKDERRFVSKTFVSKCKEVGITLCYSSSVLNELYRVIDAQIKYIRAITYDQPPVSADLLSKLSGEYEINDFYEIYYKWCKEPQNYYKDFLSFRNYLTGKINSVLADFKYMDSTLKDIPIKIQQQLFDSLKQYKTEKRSNKKTTDESVKTDVNQVLYLNSIRPKSATSLWNMNEYIVSADQLLVSWSEENFNGVPIVVIPSLWLSIILKVAGRATDDDYKSFCMFMTLRHFRTEEDDIHINPVTLLSVISQKTVDVRLKEQIIAEIITNKVNYSFDDSEDYEKTVDCAFDHILEQEKGLHKEELAKAVEDEKESSKKAIEEFQKKLENKKTSEEYAQLYAKKKAEKKVDWFAKRSAVPIFIEGIIILAAVTIIILGICKVYPFANLFNCILDLEKTSDRLFSVFGWLYNLFALSLPTYLNKVWDYLSSEKRKDKLCAKYFKQQLKVLNQ